MNKDKITRQLKVYGQSNGYNYKIVSTIMLKGKWLEKAGFFINDEIEVKICGSQIVITKKCDG